MKDLLLISTSGHRLHPTTSYRDIELKCEEIDESSLPNDIKKSLGIGI